MLSQCGDCERGCFLKLKLEWRGHRVVEEFSTERSCSLNVDSLRHPLKNLCACVLCRRHTSAELLDSNARKASDLIAKCRVGTRGKYHSRQILPRLRE